PANLQTVDVRQMNIEDDKVGPFGDQAQGIAPRGRLLDREPSPPEDHCEGTADVLVIIHAEDGDRRNTAPNFLLPRDRPRERLALPSAVAHATAAAVPWNDFPDRTIRPRRGTGGEGAGAAGRSRGERIRHRFWRNTARNRQPGRRPGRG